MNLFELSLFGIPFFMVSGDGGGGTVDLSGGDAGTGGAGGAGKAEAEARKTAEPVELTDEQLDALLKKKGVVGFYSSDPRLAKLAEPEAEKGKSKAETEKEDDELEQLLITDPKKYAVEVNRRAIANAEQNSAESVRLRNRLLRDIRKAEPDLSDESYDALEEQVETAPLSDLKKWNDSKSHITAAKAAMRDDMKTDKHRKPNTDTGRIKGGGGSGGGMEAGLQSKQSMMLQALNDAGLKVTEDDLKGSDYHPGRK